ncbi:aminopeptidase N isoform X1 [Phlebotomus papatasi]|uniref:aminopeptidase N isoform X1 n=1 Tax=Phlebotomus papatasi TaxID=29031 RepID=UPI00248384CA|nr:aminopeptidase N isoform X1 [Phlebotomus papatasi]
MEKAYVSPQMIILIFCTLLCICESRFTVRDRVRRGIDLSSTYSLISDTRLPGDFIPLNYTLDLRPNLSESTFTGKVRIIVQCNETSDRITLNAHQELHIERSDIKLKRVLEQEDSDELNSTDVRIRRASHTPKKSVFVIYLVDTVKNGTVLDLEIGFNGMIWESAEGLFKGSYLDKNGTKTEFLATMFKPNNARRLFPCFDEPAFKEAFEVSISRPKDYHTLFNTDPFSTEPLDGEPGTVVDHFNLIPGISTFSLGFLMSKLVVVKDETLPEGQEQKVKVYCQPGMEKAFPTLYEKIHNIQKALEGFWGSEYPICNLNIVALPGLTTVKPIDNWGLIVFKENELLQASYFTIAQEMVYQWIGHSTTPEWWNDAHITRAVAGFLAATIAQEYTEEFDEKWPMTVLYSIYYEFSKRYPHSRITGMKQESICSKTELLLRMINYTMGYETFRKAMQNFYEDRRCRTFQSEDIWNALTIQAHRDQVLDKSITVNEIAESWISKDRLPVVTVDRNYDKKEAVVSQKVYLRERPHDVPEQDKMRWFIPLIVVTEDKLDFTETRPRLWMEKSREATLAGLPEASKFIIVNPEEIGPFPVNYDVHNWNLLAEFLQTETGRSSIPIYTKAKLLHDAWNLAYGGHLSFATAFNMTLFMKDEKDHLVWSPVFTMIDHIGRHIDSSEVHNKFETYVRILLTPLYERLGSEAQPSEEHWKENLRSLSKTFLCRAGYRPCIERAQAAFAIWRKAADPDAETPVENQYICPVFKWGTMEEWEFGLERVINFPQNRKQNERTYLLKNLAGCPVQTEKIERLLNITILEENGNFTENDVFLIFSMLTGGSNGYTTLFNFLSNNWDTIKQRFESKTNLWDSLISSSTGIFTTQEGYDMVSALYVKHQGEFGSAEHIIEKSLKNIKEETKWSHENLPVIENWLDEYLKTANTSASKFMG